MQKFHFSSFLVLKTGTNKNIKKINGLLVFLVIMRYFLRGLLIMEED